MSTPEAFLPFTRPLIDEETIAGVAEVLRSGWITTGPQSRAFEQALSELCGGRPVRAYNSGTAALEVALRVAGIGPGDEVITTPLSWVSTASVILQVGATPVFADVDPVTRNLDLDLAARAITRKTRAIMPVHLAGLPVDLDRLYELAAEHKLRVIEDAAQACGASWRGRRIGAGGDLVMFSFHANKNVNSVEGGCLVLPDDSGVALAEKLRLMGVTRSGEDGMDVDVLGGKFNLTDVAARVGLGQLRRLEEFTERRRALARRYFECWDSRLTRLGVQLPPADFAQSCWHMFQIVLPEGGITRPDFMRRMRELGIGVGVHYPAIHLFTLYRRLGWKDGDFPEAERIGRNICTLPLFPAMADTDVDRVCVAVSRVLGTA
jgi:dTDP-4-amino-4,6-dideoxygalactose transaminase